MKHLATFFTAIPQGAKMAWNAELKRICGSNLRQFRAIISATQLVEKRVSYAEAKTDYYNALRAELPEMTDIATGRQPRPSDLDKLPTAFSVAGEKLEKAADEETSILLQRFSGNPDVKKARVEFERAQEVEERFLIPS